MMTDRGSNFVSNVTHQKVDVLGFALRYATTKLEQTIGVLEGTRASIKTSQKMSSGEFLKQWHK